MVQKSLRVEAVVDVVCAQRNHAAFSSWILCRMHSTCAALVRGDLQGHVHESSIHCASNNQLIFFTPELLIDQKKWRELLKGEVYHFWLVLLLLN